MSLQQQLSTRRSVIVLYIKFTKIEYLCLTACIAGVSMRIMELLLWASDKPYWKYLLDVEHTVVNLHLAQAQTGKMLHYSGHLPIRSVHKQTYGDIGALCMLLTCKVALSEPLISITRPAFTAIFGNLFRNWSMFNFLPACTRKYEKSDEDWCNIWKY